VGLDFGLWKRRLDFSFGVVVGGALDVMSCHIVLMMMMMMMMMMMVMMVMMMVMADVNRSGSG
jgi:hypothetical protein